MILHLNQESFQRFGTILPESKAHTAPLDLETIRLTPDTTVLFRADQRLTLRNSQGLSIVSVSTDGTDFLDFYLDKPLTLKGGTFFQLTAFQQEACVVFSGDCAPQRLGQQRANLQISTVPTLQVTELITFFYHEKEQGFLFAGESHSMVELTYVDRGCLHSVADGLDLTLQQGQLALYAPNQWHMQYADIGVAPRYVTLSFHTTGCDLQRLYNRVLQPSQQVLRLLQQMLRERDSRETYTPDMLIHMLEIMLIILLREQDAPANRIQAPHCVNTENEIIRRAQQYVSAHVREKLSVPALAAAADVSASYLTALFHKHLQLSPGEYVRRIKLQESKQMIREGTMNFTEISDALQYSTVHHFSRQFKEKFGITPTEYAKSVR